MTARTNVPRYVDCGGEVVVGDGTEWSLDDSGTGELGESELGIATLHDLE